MIQTPIANLSEQQILYFLLQFVVLVLTARVLADMMRRASQATVIGELLAGLLLGRSVLGTIAPGVEHMIFPPDPLVHHLLEACAWVGVIIYTSASRRAIGLPI